MGKDGGNFLIDLTIGGVSGAFVQTAMSPIQRVQTLMKMQDSSPKIRSGELERYKGMGDCVLRVNREQGFKAFWRGNLVNCIQYAPHQGLSLAFNDAIKRTTPEFNSKTQYWEDFGTKLVAGGVSGVLATLVCYPFNLSKARLASDVASGKQNFNGLMDCITKTVKQGGIQRLYKGFATTAAHSFVYRGGQLGIFAQVQDKNPYKAEKGIKSVVSTFICATVARMTTTPFNYPLDTVRRRMMLESEKPAALRNYSSGVNCFVQVMQKEGIQGMYKGWVVFFFRGFGGPVLLTAYDRIKLWTNIQADDRR